MVFFTFYKATQIEWTGLNVTIQQLWLSLITVLLLGTQYTHVHKYINLQQ